MNLYSNGERIIRATGKAYEAIYQAQGFRPYVKEDKAAGGAGGGEVDKSGADGAGKSDENGSGGADTGKGKKPAAGRKSAADQ